MTKVVFRLVEDLFPAGGVPHVYLPDAARACYVVHGDVDVEFSDGAQNQQQGSAWIGQDAIAIAAGRDGARIWRWELVSKGASGGGTLEAAPQVRSQVKLSAEFELDSAQEWLLRCDRVGFPPGGVALTHVHQGPGIRCCLEGEITIETPRGKSVYPAGEAWLELGYEPVLAPTTKAESTKFVRAFLLPRACRNRSSIRYVNAADADTPKVQDYFVFGERFVALPV